MLQYWSLVIGRPLSSGVRGASSSGIRIQVRILVIVHVRCWGRRWRLIITDRPWTCWFTIAGPSIKSLLRWRLVIAERRGVLGIRAITVWQTRVIALGVCSREWLAVGVPLLLVIVRHTVLIGWVRVIVTVLWFLITTSTANSTAADIIPTRWVVVISVWLLVRVIS